MFNSLANVTGFIFKCAVFCVINQLFENITNKTGYLIKIMSILCTYCTVVYVLYGCVRIVRLCTYCTVVYVLYGCVRIPDHIKFNPLILDLLQRYIFNDTEKNKTDLNTYLFKKILYIEP
jgi:hypothetical protein